MLDVLRAEGPDDVIKLYATHEKIDGFIAGDNTMVSVKSIDLTAKTYVDNPSRIYDTIEKYAKSIDPMEHSQLRVTYTNPITGIEVTDMFKGPRELMVAMPSEGATAAQAEMFSKVIKSHPGVRIRIVEVPQ